MVNQPQRATLYPYRKLTITSKVQECCWWEFAAKLGEFDYSTFVNVNFAFKFIVKYAFPNSFNYLKL